MDNENIKYLNPAMEICLQLNLLIEQNLIDIPLENVEEAIRNRSFTKYLNENCPRLDLSLILHDGSGKLDVEPNPGFENYINETVESIQNAYGHGYTSGLGLSLNYFLIVVQQIVRGK